jgi:acetyl esterase/lipase
MGLLLLALGWMANQRLWAAPDGAQRSAAATGANAAPAASLKPRRVEPELGTLLTEQLDVVYARYGERALKLDLYRPKRQAGLLPAVVIVHGGGWINGDKTKFRGLAQRLAERGYVTAAIEYRLAGEAKFPAAVHDCNAAVRWLRANADTYGIDPQHIGAVGGSAGGHLVGLMAAAPHLRELQGEGGNAGVSSQLQAAVVMAGPLELATGPVAERSRHQPEISNSNRWLDKTVDEAPELYRLASPSTHLSSTTPAMLFMHGELDHPEQNAASRKRLVELGVPTALKVYKNGKHGCWNQHPWFDVMLDDIDDFLRPHLQPTGDASGSGSKPNHQQELSLGRIPDDGLTSIPRWNNPVAALFAKIDDKQIPLTLRAGPQSWTIVFPRDLAGRSAPPVVIETVGRPYASGLPRIATASPGAIVALPAHDSVTHGESLRYEPQPHKNTLGFWTNPDDWCQWFVYVEQPGRYRLEVLQGCGAGQGGSEVVARLGDQQLSLVVEDTGHFQNFKPRDVGMLTVDEPGVYSLELRPRTKAAKAVMDVRQVRLLPVGS